LSAALFRTLLYRRAILRRFFSDEERDAEEALTHPHAGNGQSPSSEQVIAFDRNARPVQRVFPGRNHRNLQLPR
jgi:hypothetical protein